MYVVHQLTNYIFSYIFLATGESFRSLALAYRLGRKTVADSVHMTCRAVVDHMMETQMPKPTEESWTAIAEHFWRRWQFPNCIGAIDGKHIQIQAPKKSCSQFFNYKKTFSIILLALVDADSKFIIIQVGDFGRASDGGVFAHSALGRGMSEKTLNVPEDTPLPGYGQQGDGRGCCVSLEAVPDATLPWQQPVKA